MVILSGNSFLFHFLKIVVIFGALPMDRLDPALFPDRAGRGAEKDAPRATLLGIPDCAPDCTPSPRVI